MVDVSLCLLRHAKVSLYGLAVLLLPAPALGNPAVEACQGKTKGDPCGLMTMVKPEGGGPLERKTVPGVCRSEECCELDYSKGSPPQSVCQACLSCAEGPADVAPADGASASAEGSPANGGDAEPPRTAEDGPPAPPPGQKRGCRLGDPIGPAPTVAMLALLALWTRRRAPASR